MEVWLYTWNVVILIGNHQVELSCITTRMLSLLSSDFHNRVDRE